MKWIRVNEKKEKTLPPVNQNVFIKAYFQKDPIIGIGYWSEYQEPHWETGMKIYGNSKLPDSDPKYIEWLDESPSTEVKGQQGEWQLCPKCYGDGHLGRYNSPNLSTTATPICDVCNGAKILAKPSQPQEVGQDELLQELLDEHSKWHESVDDNRTGEQLLKDILSKFTLIKK